MTKSITGLFEENGRGLSVEDLKALAAPFADDVVMGRAQKVTADARDASRRRVLFVPYLQKNSVAERVESVDPNYSFADLQVGEGEFPDESQKNTVRGFWCAATMTIKGVRRAGVGIGKNPKVADSDSFKRCAHSFGVGRKDLERSNEWVSLAEGEEKRSYTWARVLELAGKRAPASPQKRFAEKCLELTLGDRAEAAVLCLEISGKETPTLLKEHEAGAALQVLQAKEKLWRRQDPERPFLAWNNREKTGAQGAVSGGQGGDHRDGAPA